eukprot:CAMPEP_0195526458 /NCGR_PEP_ID=MMETSP0794_2-20130614/27529_1 /TAXON_ID=515487 /ORGANISM="Stephanopyxis turris, Strain CCMP 815" /LENGTH=316 /DNA_ID=CAMNT_0040657143 /DNA_START=29 /DNA_END=979 /DNA_ORIENTATION=+
MHKRSYHASNSSSFSSTKNSNSTSDSTVIPKIPLCSFCQSNKAAVIVTGQLTQKPLCLLHYYTTRAARTFPSHKIKAIKCGGELQSQLPPVQDLFSEAFLELQKEISEVSAKAFVERSSDPLSILNPGGGGGANGFHARRKQKNSNILAQTEGGFIKPIQIPQKLALLHQQKQQRKLAARVGAAPSSEDGNSQDALGAALAAVQSNPFKRRRQNKVSYWDLDGSGGGGGGIRKKGADASSLSSSSKNKMMTWADIENASRLTISCSCGSNEVESDGNITGRNNDMAKGETWGNKDRSDVMMKCRCLKCGKTWNEEG